MRLVVVVLILLPFLASAQKRKPKVSYSRGTLFGYVGYNRSAFSNSTISFTGPGYDFSLKGVKGEDDPTKFSPAVQLNPLQFTTAQYNVRLGYYIRNHFAISIGFDKLKYVMADQNQVLLSGTINPGVDPVNGWSGTYTNQSVTTNQSTFDYRNAGGLNYIRLELSRTDQLLKIGRNSWFALSTNGGIGLGGLYSNTAFNFGGKSDYGTTSFSGIGVSGHASIRLEFLRHLFIQSGFSGGYMHQMRVGTNTNEPNATAKHRFAYGSFETVLGFLLYIRPTNDCNSCPNW